MPGMATDTLSEMEALARAERDRTRDARRVSLAEAMERGDRTAVDKALGERHPQDGLINIELLEAAAKINADWLALLAAGCSRPSRFRDAFRRALCRSDMFAIENFLQVADVALCQAMMSETARVAGLPVLRQVWAQCDPATRQSMALRAAAEVKKWDMVRFLLPLSDPNAKHGKVLDHMLGAGGAPDDLVLEAMAGVTDDRGWVGAACAAARSGRSGMLHRALVRVADPSMTCSKAVLGAVVNGQAEVVAFLLMQGTPDRAYDRMVTVAVAEGNEVLWEHVDFLGAMVDEKTQAQWLKEHAGHLPKTVAAHMARRRANRTEGLESLPARRTARARS